MAFSLTQIKNICKDKGYKFSSNCLLGVSKNDSRKCDFYIDTKEKLYAVKVFATGQAKSVYFMSSLGYINLQGEGIDTDYMWNCHDFSYKKSSQKNATPILLITGEAGMIDVAKNSATTLTNGSKIFDCSIYKEQSFYDLLLK